MPRCIPIPVPPEVWQRFAALDGGCDARLQRLDAARLGVMTSGRNSPHVARGDLLARRRCDPARNVYFFMAAAWQVILLADLVREWHRRLRELHQALANARDRDNWLSEVRARVLTFLVARYSDRTKTLNPEVPIARVQEPRDFAYCIVEPGEHPPRSGQNIRPLLVDIMRQNTRRRPRWRFWP